MAKRHHITEAERVALKLSKIVNDVTLDLDDVGRYLADLSPTISYNRLILIAEAAIERKEMNNVRFTHDPLF